MALARKRRQDVEFQRRVILSWKFDLLLGLVIKICRTRHQWFEWRVKSDRRRTGNRKNVFVVIDNWSMSFGIEMLAKSILVVKWTTALLALDRFGLGFLNLPIMNRVYADTDSKGIYWQ